MDVTDHIHILRQGRFVASTATIDTNEQELARNMIGEIQQQAKSQFAQRQISSGLQLKDVSFQSTNERLPFISNLNFVASSGAITGVAGVDGNGQSELTNLLIGQIQTFSGQLIFGNQSFSQVEIKNILRPEIAYIPADRMRHGLAMDLSVRDNLIIREGKNQKFFAFGFENRNTIDEYCQKLVHEYDIEIQSLDQKVSTLSGGNQQKILLARELSSNPRVVIMAQPTRGLDFKSTNYVHKKIREQAEKSATVVLISTDLDEIMYLCDSFYVINDGILSDPIKPDSVSSEQLGLLFGSKPRQLEL
jgi:simple sugar transport system ATP-binding protein